MNTLNSVTFVGGIVFTAYVVFASAYWVEAGRWSDKIKQLSDEAEVARARKNRRRTERIFNFCTGTAVLTIILTVVPLYVPGQSIAKLCKWLLLIPLTCMILLCIRYATGKYFVDID